MKVAVIVRPGDEDFARWIIPGNIRVLSVGCPTMGLRFDRIIVLANATNFEKFDPVRFNEWIDCQILTRLAPDGEFRRLMPRRALSLTDLV